MSRINNLREAFDYLNVEWSDDIDKASKALERRMFKATAAGLPASFSLPGKVKTGVKKIQVTAAMRQSVGRTVLVSVRKRHGRAVPPSEAPEMAEYFARQSDTNPNLWVCHLSRDEIRALDTEIRTTFRGLETWVTSWVEVPVFSTHKGVLHFTPYAEGANGCAQPVTVTLPCSGEEIDDAIRHAEQISEEMWDAVHGEAGR